MSTTRSREMKWIRLGQHDESDQEWTGRLSYSHTSDTVTWEATGPDLRFHVTVFSYNEWDAVLAAAAELEKKP